MSAVIRVPGEAQQVRVAAEAGGGSVLLSLLAVLASGKIFSLSFDFVMYKTRKLQTNSQNSYED